MWSPGDFLCNPRGVPWLGELFKFLDVVAKGVFPDSPNNYPSSSFVESEFFAVLAAGELAGERRAGDANA